MSHGRNNEGNLLVDESVDKADTLSNKRMDNLLEHHGEDEALSQRDMFLKMQALERELEKKTAELEKALAVIDSLTGIIPICSCCKKIRDEEGYWQEIDVYMRHRAGLQFSHGLCEDCIDELYPELFKKRDRLRCAECR